MWNDDDRKWLYNQMRKNGVDTGSYDDFSKSLDNKEDRDWYYQKSRSLGLNVGSAADFASMMVQPVQNPAPSPSPAQPVVKQTTGQVNPTVNTSTQPKQVGMQIDETIQNVNQRQQNMMEYSKQRLQHPFGQPQVQIGLNRKNTPTVFDNRNLVQGRDGFNPETGKLEPTYLTASGNKYNSKVMADAEQRQIDKETERALHPVETELRDAYAERDKLQKELDERGKGVRGSMDMLSYATAAVNNDGRIPEWNDREYQKLESALRSNQKRIKALEAEMADHGQTQFWRGFADTTTDPDTWLFGIPGLMDAGALWGVSQKLNKGKPLTEGEKAVLEQSMKENQVQAQYGSNRGSMYSWGNISAAALPFVAEFVATGGMSGVASAGTIAGERAAAKYATNAATKWLMKNTGTLAGDVAAGFVMANTTGAAKTVGNAISRHVGNATIDKNGKYGFEGGEDWIPSVIYRISLPCVVIIWD